MQTLTYRPERTMLAVVLVMLLGALPLGLSSWWLAPALVLPLGSLAWVLRARVVADGQAVEVCNGLVVRRIAWGDVEGFQVPDRGPARLLRRGASPLRLTALARRDLRALMEFSRGHDV